MEERHRITRQELFRLVWSQPRRRVAAAGLLDPSDDGPVHGKARLARKATGASDRVPFY